MFREVSLAYSNAHRTMHSGKKCGGDRKGFYQGITNGAMWYSVSGGMQDWNYLHTNDFEITLELGCYKYPPPKQLPTFWDDNREALLAYMAKVHMGVKGMVRDKMTSLPIAGAVVEVDSIKHPIKSGMDGDYFRLLTPGTYK